MTAVILVKEAVSQNNFVFLLPNNRLSITALFFKNSGSHARYKQIVSYFYLYPPYFLRLLLPIDLRDSPMFSYFCCYYR